MQNEEYNYKAGGNININQSFEHEIEFMTKEDIEYLLNEKVFIY